MKRKLKGEKQHALRVLSQTHGALDTVMSLHYSAVSSVRIGYLHTSAHVSAECMEFLPGEKNGVCRRGMLWLVFLLYAFTLPITPLSLSIVIR